MIEIKSKTLSTVQVEKNQVFYFKEGLFGFESYKDFALIKENENSVFQWLQSMEEEQLAFLLISPLLFHENYKPDITKEELAKISLLTIEPKNVLVIVTIPDNNFQAMTANLQGPIIFNPENLTGQQFISRNENHLIREKILK